MFHAVVSSLEGPLFVALVVGAGLQMLHTLIAFIAFLVVARRASSGTRLEAFRILVQVLRQLRPLPVPELSGTTELFRVTKRSSGAPVTGVAASKSSKP
jgi:hypothetical protein